MTSFPDGPEIPVRELRRCRSSTNESFLRITYRLPFRVKVWRFLFGH